MGRKYGLIFLSVMLFCLAAGKKAYAAEADRDFSIKQVSAVMPEITVFMDCDMDQEESEQAQARLGEEKLTFLERKDVEETGISYYFLLDISDSIPKAYFNQMKQELMNFAEGLEEKSEMTLYTFGYDVTEVFLQENDAKEIQSAMEGIGNTDRNTLLFEAIDVVAQEAAKQTGDKRVVLVTITDGEDFALGKSTQSEALNALLQNGLSMEAVTVDCSKKEYINNFGEFARTTGGTLYIAGQEDFGDIFGQIRQSAASGTQITYLASSNRVSNQIAQFSLQPAGTEVVFRKEILLTKSKPDTVPPMILAVEKKTDRVLVITFSEKVLNADRASAWKVIWQGENVPIESVNQNEQNQITQVELTVSKDLYAGEYIVTGNGITDVSQEENPLQGEKTVMLEGSLPEDEPANAENEPSGNRMLFVIVIVLICAVILLIVTATLIFHRIKRNKGIARVEGKHVLVSNAVIEVHEEGKIIEEQGKKITLIVDRDGRNTSKIDTVIDKSLFVGRSPICNIYFNDKFLSDQHFVLEYDGANMFVTDLNTSNGTKVNGIPVSRRHRLNANDVIAAGSLHFRVRW